MGSEMCIRDSVQQRRVRVRTRHQPLARDHSHEQSTRSPQLFMSRTRTDLSRQTFHARPPSFEFRLAHVVSRLTRRVRWKHPRVRLHRLQRSIAFASSRRRRSVPASSSSSSFALVRPPSPFVPVSTLARRRIRRPRRLSVLLEPFGMFLSKRPFARLSRRGFLPVARLGSIDDGVVQPRPSLSLGHDDRGVRRRRKRRALECTFRYNCSRHGATAPSGTRATEAW